jgi:hypothetical protein
MRRDGKVLLAPVEGEAKTDVKIASSYARPTPEKSNLSAKKRSTI